MKKLLFLLFLTSISVEIQGFIQNFDEQVSYFCEICQKNISQNERRLALLIDSKNPIFICDVCRNKQKGKEGAQLQNKSTERVRRLEITSSRELEGSDKKLFMKVPWARDFLLKQYLKKNKIDVSTPSGYQIIAQKEGSLPFFFVKSPGVEQYELIRFPITYKESYGRGLNRQATVAVQGMSLLKDNKILIISGKKENGSELIYLYNPQDNSFRRIEEGEEFQEEQFKPKSEGETVETIEKCDESINGKLALSKFLHSLKTEYQEERYAQKIKDKKILTDFFNELLKKQKAKKSAEKEFDDTNS